MNVKLTEEQAIWELWDSAPLAVIAVDDNGRIQYANPETTNVFGYQPDELRGQDLSLITPPTIQAVHEDHVQNFFATPRTRAMGKLRHLQARHKDGTLFPVEIGLSFFQINNSMMAISLIKDVSDSKKLEVYAQQLIEQNADLESFAHVVAHDLKSPLAQIMGFAGTLQSVGDRLSKEQLHTHLEMIYQISSRAVNTIDEILLMSSLQRDNIPFQQLDMTQIITDVLASLQSTIEQQRATITTPNQWPTVYGYAPWVVQVWTNYLTNALKYGGQGVQIELGVDGMGNEQACFWVQDNGPGISPDQQETLFEEYTRVDSRQLGHGLGLSIARNIIEKLHGEVGLSSIAGQGSRFYFTLPLNDQSNA